MSCNTGLPFQIFAAARQNWGNYTLPWHTVPLIFPIFLKRSLVFFLPLFSSISLHFSIRKPFCLPLLFSGTLYLVGCTFPFLPCFSLLFFLQLFIKPPHIMTLLSFFSFSLGWFIPISCPICYSAISQWHIGYLPTWGTHFFLYLFSFLHSLWGSHSKYTWVVCHSLLHWIMFCQKYPLWPVYLEWPSMAWLIATLSYTSPFNTKHVPWRGNIPLHMHRLVFFFF